LKTNRLDRPAPSLQRSSEIQRQNVKDLSAAGEFGVTSIPAIACELLEPSGA